MVSESSESAFCVEVLVTKAMITFLAETVVYGDAVATYRWRVESFVVMLAFM